MTDSVDRNVLMFRNFCKPSGIILLFVFFYLVLLVRDQWASPLEPEQSDAKIIPRIGVAYISAVSSSLL